MAVIKDFKCKSCEHVQEGWTDEANECKVCGKETEPIISAVAFSFKWTPSGSTTNGVKFHSDGKIRTYKPGKGLQ